MDMHFLKEVTKSLSTEIKFISGSTLFKTSKNIYSFNVYVCVCAMCILPPGSMLQIKTL